MATQSTTLRKCCTACNRKQHRPKADESYFCTRVAMEKILIIVTIIMLMCIIIVIIINIAIFSLDPYAGLLDKSSQGAYIL